MYLLTPKYLTQISELSPQCNPTSNTPSLRRLILLQIRTRGLNIFKRETDPRNQFEGKINKATKRGTRIKSLQLIRNILFKKVGSKDHEVVLQYQFQLQMNESLF